MTNMQQGSPSRGRVAPVSAGIKSGPCNQTMPKLRVLDLFSGIGGFSLGLERTGGFETVAFCEIEEFPRRVLAKHWPEVPCYHDVRELTAARLAADGIRVDVICGGFPCQDISTAGEQAGIEEGTRSGLWSEIDRLIGELRPKFVIVENVANLLSGPREKRGGWFGRVLGDLAERRFDAEWQRIPASALGAHHRRERVWIVAYPNGQPEGGLPLGAQTQEPVSHIRFENVADADGFRPSRQGRAVELCNPAPRLDWKIDRAVYDSRWATEPDVGRMAYGVPNGAHRLKGLGNAVVPQIPELIGNAILEARTAA